MTRTSCRTQVLATYWSPPRILKRKAEGAHTKTVSRESRQLHSAVQLSAVPIFDDENRVAAAIINNRELTRTDRTSGVRSLLEATEEMTNESLAQLMSAVNSDMRIFGSTKLRKPETHGHPRLHRHWKSLMRSTTRRRVIRPTEASDAIRRARSRARARRSS